jgi:multidrug efflux system membrane fusion protein
MCTRNGIWRSVFVAASMLFVLGLAPCFADDQSKPASASPAAEPPIVAGIKPAERAVTDNEVFVGRIQAAESVDIVSRVTGYLTKTAFREGADVKKGDVLFEIDARPYQAQVEKAQAEVRVNEARLQAAQAEFDRASEMARTAAIGRQELDKSRSMKEETLAALDAAKANLRAHQLTLSFCTVVAPIDGRVGRSNLTPGNLVTQDKTVLTTIVSLDPVYAYFDIDERTLLRMRKASDAGGRRQPESGGETPAFLGLADEGDFPHRGIINFVSNQVDPATGTISMRAVFENPESKGGTRLYVPGMFVRVQLPIGKPRQRD